MSPINVLMIGTGEYTTGYVHGIASDLDIAQGRCGNCRKSHKYYLGWGGSSRILPYLFFHGFTCLWKGGCRLVRSHVPRLPWHGARLTEFFREAW